MTSQGPDDRFDPFETRLAARVQRLADRGVRPIDAAEIARQSAAGPKRSRFGFVSPAARLGWIAASAAVAVVAFAGGAYVAGSGLFTPASSPQASAVAVLPTAPPASVAASEVTPSAVTTPTAPPTTAPVVACDVANLRAQVTTWTGAAGSRMGTVELTNDGPACHLRKLDRPELVDGSGNLLLDGMTPSSSGTLLLDAGATVRTTVDAADYCGAAPVAPVTVNFIFSSGQTLHASPRSSTDTFGVPPCLGNDLPGSITMHPWAP